MYALPLAARGACFSFTKALEVKDEVLRQLLDNTPAQGFDLLPALAAAEGVDSGQYLLCHKVL